MVVTSIPQAPLFEVQTALEMIAWWEIVAALKGTGRVCSRLVDECMMPSRGDLCIGGFAY